MDFEFYMVQESLNAIIDAPPEMLFSRLNDKLFLTVLFRAILVGVALVGIPSYHWISSLGNVPVTLRFL